MVVFADGALCQGKVGKKGVEYLIEASATAEECQEACLRDASCKYAALLMKGSPKKWKCVNFKKKCKISKGKKRGKKKSKKDVDKEEKDTPAVSYKKTRVKSSQIEDPKYFYLPA
jgi:hypothetical protein